MEPKFTDAQKSAIDTRNKTLLVSAAAGSGKTYTLIQRIINRISDKDNPADISKMLIVTFTRAAASELRTRLFKELGKALAQNPSDKHLASQLMKLESAKICTIDSFYLDIVRSNFSSLDLPAGFRLADESEYDLLAKRVMESSIDKLYASSEDFPAFTECFTSVRSSNSLSEVFLQLYSELSVLPEGIEYIKNCAELTKKQADLDFFSTSYGETLKKCTREFFEHYEGVFASAVAYMETDEETFKAYGSSFAYDLDFCKRVLKAVNDKDRGYSQIKSLLEDYSPIKLKRLSSDAASEYSVIYKNMRTTFSKKSKELLNKSFGKDDDTIKRAMGDTAKNLGILYLLMKEFEEAVTEEKKRISLLTFNDVRRYTMKLLVDCNGEPTETAKKYAEQFSEIYIDEYQDVDRVQDLIFRAVSKENNRFMVGDIKQSIYGFRGAEPMLFSEYRKAFPDVLTEAGKKSDQASIFMSENFRCDESVIKFTNTVCSAVFSACADSIGYTSKDNLIFAKKAECDKKYTPDKVKVVLVTKPDADADENEEISEEQDTKSAKELEAEYIAGEIEKLIKHGTRADGKKILPGDIAVLFRAKSMNDILSSALRKRGILVSEPDGERYFENPNVLMMLCVLNTVDNPQRDVYLAGTLRSPVFNFSMDELITIRSCSASDFSLYDAVEAYGENGDNPLLAEKCEDFLSTLETWQNDAASLPIDRFLRMLFDSPKFTSSGIVSQTDANGEGGDLLVLYEYARKFESGSFKGLYQFIEYINSVIEENGKITSSDGGTTPDRVSLMTIHKSKGLEFPVCFVCNSGASVTPKNSRNSLVFDYPSGIAMKIADGSGFARINTPMREAVIAQSAVKQMEEEMRILYVALTRAKEKLYVTGYVSNPSRLYEKARINAAFPDRYTVMKKCTSYLDWILLGTKGEESPFFTFEEVCPNSASTDTAPEKITVTPSRAEPVPQLVEKLKKEFSFKYEYTKLSHVPSKISVSKLYPDFLDENDDSFELFSDDGAGTQIPNFFLESEKISASSAERGTATHLFLQFCNFERASRTGVKEELARLEQMKFLPSAASSLIYADELEAFMSSKLMEMILSADEVIREQRFNFELSADGFSSDDGLISKLSGENLAVQGVIDLILIGSDGNITLVDYKTDRLNGAELKNDALAAKKMNEFHGIQLSYYAKAVEVLFGKKCSRVCVYSTHSAKLYDIDLRF